MSVVATAVGRISDARRSGARALLLTLAATLVVVVLFKLAISDGGRDLPSLSVAQVIVFILLAVMVWKGAVLRTAVTYPLVGIVAAMVFASLWSVRPEASVRGLLLWTMYLGITVVVSSTVSSVVATRRFLDALVVTAGWLCLIALFMFWGADNPGMRWYSTFYWPNPFASFVLLVYPLTVVRFAHTGTLRESLVHGATALLLGTALVLTYSRGAWLALVLVTPLGLALLRPRNWLAAGLRTALLAAVTLLVIVLITQGGAMQSTPQGAVGRAASAGDLSDYAIRGRLYFWRAGLEIFVDHPLVGTGPGTFSAVHAVYQRDARYFARDAHNLYIQTAAEMGLVGLAALALLLAATFGVWTRGLKAARGKPEYPEIAGAGLGLAAFLIHSAVDMTWMFPANPAMAFAVIGVLAQYDRAQTPSVPAMIPRKPLLRRLVAAALVIGIGAVVAVQLAHREFVAAQEQARRGQWASAAEGYRRAVRWNPLSANYLVALAGALMQTAPADPAADARPLRRAMALDRMNAAIPLRLARVLLEERASPPALPEAETLLRRSLALDPWNRPETYRTLAALYLRQGRMSDADRVYEEAITRYVGRNLGTASAIYVLLWPEVAALFLDAAEASVQHGNPALAAQRLETLLAEDPNVVPAVVRLSEIYMTMDRREDAHRLLQAAATRMPDDSRLAAALERLR